MDKRITVPGDKAFYIVNFVLGKVPLSCFSQFILSLCQFISIPDYFADLYDFVHLFHEILLMNRIFMGRDEPFGIKGFQAFQEQLQFTQADTAAAGIDIFLVTVTEKQNFVLSDISHSGIFAVRSAHMMKLDQQIFQADIDAGVKGNISGRNFERMPHRDLFADTFRKCRDLQAGRHTGIQGAVGPVPMLHVDETFIRQ